MPLILVTPTSRCDSDCECLNISFNENKLDGVDLNLIVLAVAFERTKEKFYGFWKYVFFVLSLKYYRSWITLSRRRLSG